MGTNFYAIDRSRQCRECKRGVEQIHLGKSSYGWQFSFQLNDGKFYHDVPTMREWLKGQEILDEYDKEITYEDFWNMVDAKQEQFPGQNHAALYPSNCDFVIGGYSFTNREFS